MNNEDDVVEELSDSDLTSSDEEPDDDSRAPAALDGDGTTLAADDDFASAVARAAQLAGLTVVGTTVTDSAKGLLLLILGQQRYMCVNHEETGETHAPEFGVGDTNANCPPDFVMFQNFKDHIACIVFAMQKNVMPTLALMAIGDGTNRIYC